MESPAAGEAGAERDRGDAVHEIAVLGCNGPFAKPLGGVFIRYAILGIEIFNR